MQELTGQVAQTLTEPPIPADPPTLPPPISLQENSEPRFFTSPKPAVKKTQLSITAFQLITAAAACLLLKACQLLSPELFANIHRYLEHLFQW